MVKKVMKKQAKAKKTASKKLAGSKNKRFLKTALKKKAKQEKKQGEKQLIAKNMLIGEIAMKCPKAVPVMFKHGMHCIGCGMTAYETLEQGCKSHGMNDKDIDKMVEEMNKALGK